jgi:transcriptional regulator with XRE-family HTH domain
MAKGERPPFGRRLRELREAAALTQAQLADRAGMHPQAVVKLERGEREPSWASAVALAEALGVDCRAFLEAPSGPPPEPRRGRPRKERAAGPAPKRPRGRPPKAK